MTGDKHETGNAFEYSIRLEAAADDVWRALTDGAELQRWFPISARLKPGVGGSIFLSWGPGCEGEGPITLWEPGRAIGWQETHDKDAPGGPVEIAVQFFIDYEFKSRILGAVMGAMFDRAFRTFSEAFEKRADEIYRAIG